MITADIEARFWKKVITAGMSDCWIWTGAKNSDGYGHLSVNGNMTYCHRIAWEINYGSIERGLEVLHRCDNPTCCNPWHLRLGTHAENMRDMHEKGRANNLKGEKHPSAKITESEVRSIRFMHREGVTIRAIAEAFIISASSIYGIITRKTWKHVI